MRNSPVQIETTGVLQFPLRILAWEGISVIEIMIIVRDFEVDRAVAAIRQGLQSVKNHREAMDKIAVK